MNTLFWFRRDLRLFSNEALIEALNNGAKQAIFFISKSNGNNTTPLPFK
jgi:deoxyribodipyrimidine photo-lyase